MCRSSKSPRKVILVALAVGRRGLPDYAHRFSPKVFTQPQLFACLALMAFLRTDYRGVEEHLRDAPFFRELIGLSRTPDHATLHRAHRRLLSAARADRLLAASLHIAFAHGTRRRASGGACGGRAIIHLAAADSTGLQTGHRSAYFVRRRARGQKHAKNPLYQTTSYSRYPKLTALADCATHLILACLTGVGPRPDVRELKPLLARCPRAVALTKLVADAGFDSEPNHRLAREFHGIASLMPARHGRPTKGGKPLSGRYRRLMSRRLRTKRGRRQSGYTQRWQVETVMSMIKRNLGDELSGHSHHARNRQMRLLVVVHNCMILLVGEEVCDGADLSRFYAPTEQKVYGRWRLPILESLNNRLHDIRRLDRGLDVFGAKKHGYRSTPVSAADLSALEADLGVELPRDYRTFLLEIGYGAGPYYGIRSPHEALADLRELAEWYEGEKGTPVSPALPFPFQSAILRDIGAKAAAGMPSIAQHDWPCSGCLPICDQGCTFWSVLVLNGDFAGHVWDLACFTWFDGEWSPARRPTGTLYDRTLLPPLVTPPTFTEWMNAWLEQSLADLAAAPASSTPRMPHNQPTPRTGAASIVSVIRRLLRRVSGR